MAPASAPAVSAASPAVVAPAKTGQQSKMATCNKDATGKKGDERKAFMKECLSAKKEVVAQDATQQSKMKTCNAEAKGKKGDARKAFMKECLSK
ncbi:MAG: phosphate starvation-inducible protein PsiF [Xanthomonadaceae bacterium]|nr:phosphate starvation-inducible protein PsiF [Xanthomonadaceae bacterium]